MALNFNLRVSASAHAQLSYILTCAFHMEEIICKVLHIFRSCFMLKMKGNSIIWSRGRQFSPSMPGDRYLKLGSFSTTRWRHVQRYCSEFPRFMVILVIQFSDYFMQANANVRKLKFSPLSLENYASVQNISSFYFNQEYIYANHYEHFQIIIRLSKQELSFQ